MPSDTFQRRHLNALADMVRNLGCLTEFQRRSVATELAYALRANSPRVDVDRFIAAATDTGRIDRADYVAPTIPVPVPQVPQVPRLADWEQELLASTPPTRVELRCSTLGCQQPPTHQCGGREVFYCRDHSGTTCCTPITEML